MGEPGAQETGRQGQNREHLRRQAIDEVVMERQRRKQRGTTSGGLYQGEAGAFAAQQDPMAYFTSMGMLGGGYPRAGSPFEQYMQEIFIPNTYRQYQAALATP